MSDEIDGEPREPTGILAAHPWITGIFAICAVIGAVVGAVSLPEDFSLARRIAGGAVAGAGFAMLVLGPKLMVR